MLPAASLLMAGVCWGFVGTFARFAVERGVDPSEIAFWRAVFAGATFTLWNFLGARRRIERADRGRLLAFATLGLGLLVLSNQKSIAHGGAGFGAIFLYAAPVWVALHGKFFRRERLSGLKAAALLATLLGVLGVGALGGGEMRFSTLALVWGVVSGLSYALLYVLGRPYYAKYPAALWNGSAFVIAAVMLAPLVEFHPKDGVAWAGIAAGGVVSTVLSYAFYAWGLKRTNATMASILCSSEPVVAIAAAYLVWGETMSAWGYASSALVLVGVTLAAFAESRAPVMAETENPRSA